MCEINKWNRCATIVTLIHVDEPYGVTARLLDFGSRLVILRHDSLGHEMWAFKWFIVLVSVYEMWAFKWFNILVSVCGI